MQSLPLEVNTPTTPATPWRRRARWFGWSLFVLVVAGIVVAAISRESIMLSYPASRSVYAAFGVQPRDPADGISVVDIVSGSQVDAGTVMLVVEGRVENVAQGTRRVPQLLATLYDEGDREILSWTFNVDEPVLEAGDSVAFRTAIRPPERNFSSWPSRYQSGRPPIDGARNSSLPWPSAPWQVAHNWNSSRPRSRSCARAGCVVPAASAIKTRAVRYPLFIPDPSPIPRRATGTAADEKRGGV